MLSTESNSNMNSKQNLSTFNPANAKSIETTKSCSEIFNHRLVFDMSNKIEYQKKMIKDTRESFPYPNPLIETESNHNITDHNNIMCDTHMPINTNTEDSGHTNTQSRKNEKDKGEVTIKGEISSFGGEQTGLGKAQRKDCDIIVTINPLIPIQQNNENNHI